MFNPPQLLALPRPSISTNKAPLKSSIDSDLAAWTPEPWTVDLDNGADEL
jgi:hypothetical protein